MKFIKISRRIIFCAALFGALCAVAGCTSSLNEPFDINSLRFKYEMSTGEYSLVITKHLVSESNVVIPENINGIPVRAIGDKAFAGDKGIKSLTLCKGLKYINDFAFENCTSLQDVNYGSELTVIKAGAFSGCSSLENFNMRDDVTSSDVLLTLGKGVFDKCGSLCSTDIAGRIDVIGDYAFQDCTSLTDFHMSGNTVKIGRGAFYGCINLGDITLPKGINEIGGLAFEGTAWLHALADSRDFVIVGDGVLIKYSGRKKAPELPDNVKKISGAFAGNTDIRAVVINKKATVVGDMSFFGCTSLKTVDLPSGISKIGSMAFASCSSLETVYIPNVTKSIAYDDFKHCYKVTLYVPRNSAAHKFCSENKLEYRFSDD